jgi:predicted dehydrogenase
MNQRQWHRRQFLSSTAAAGLAFTAQARTAAKGAIAANDTIVLGIIGSGRRGRRLMESFLKQPNVAFAAVCDVYEDYRNQGLKIAGEGAKGYLDHRELLDRKDIDAVVIATPDHWHHPQLADAIAAGKDVYLEKPMSWSIEQGQAMVRLVRNAKQVVQVGMQRRSAPGMIEAWTLVQSGLLGEVNFAHAQWFWNMRPLPERRPLQGALDWARFRGPHSTMPLDEPRNSHFFNWRYFWDFSGGNMTDQGTHLMDVIQWFLNDGKPPRSAVCQGNVYRLQPAETPDVFTAVFEYPHFLATWTLAYTNSYQDGWSVTLQGDKATMVLDDKGYRVYPDPGRGKPALPPSHDVKAQLTVTDPHVENFLQCVRTREEPNAPVEVGHNAVSGPHLANIALRKRAKAILAEDGTVAVAL